MTHYELTQLATRICEHGKNTVCGCTRKQPSPAVAAYLERAKRRYPAAISYNREWSPDYAKHERFRCIENAADGLRFVGKVHEIRMSGDGNLPYIDRAMIDHNGWYTDPYRDTFKDGTGLCYGVVYQLPSRRGEWQYVPGCEDGGTDGGPILDFHGITSDIREAIRWADKMAESYAESEREYQAKSMAEDKISEAETEIKDIRHTMHGLFAEIKANRTNEGNAPAIRAAVCAQIRTHRNRIKKLIREKLRLQDDFWNAVPEDCRY